MHYNQLLLIKFGKNFVIVTEDVKMTSKVQTDDICYFEYIWRPEQPLLWPGSIENCATYVVIDLCFLLSGRNPGF